MARQLRIEHPGAWYHLTARGNERQPIYRHARDYERFCELLSELVGRSNWRLHAYVLMKNHFHLLVETPEPNLSAGMQWLGVSYSVWFNRRHGRSGHLFQGRFKSIIVDPLAWAVELSRYVHLNPVRLGSLGLGKTDRAAARTAAAPAPDAQLLARRLERLRQFRWSSYGAYVGSVRRPQWLTCDRLLESMGDGDLTRRQRQYRQYVEEGVRQGLLQSPWEELKAQVVLGSEKFLRKIREVMSGNPREQPSLRRLAQRPDWETVKTVIEKLKGEKWAAFQNRRGDWGRDLALYLGRQHCQLKLSELGALAGGMDYASVAMAARRFKQRMSEDKTLARYAQQAINEMFNVKT